VPLLSFDLFCSLDGNDAARQCGRTSSLARVHHLDLLLDTKPVAGNLIAI
jgi:hypothetical protein